ncbi:hypothetical protein P4233_22590 [Pseudomonas aeruginosa]|nr:hypothetical protein [Pseudomonas aeruginosa]
MSAVAAATAAPERPVSSRAASAKTCKRRSDINPKNVLIAAALIVYIGVNVAAYIKDHPPRELTAEQREKIAEGQRLATRAAMMAGYVD